MCLKCLISSLFSRMCRRAVCHFIKKKEYTTHQRQPGVSTHQYKTDYYFCLLKTDAIFLIDQ